MGKYVPFISNKDEILAPILPFFYGKKNPFSNSVNGYELSRNTNSNNVAD